MSNVRWLFLPPNTTSHLQPLDQGVIATIKALYRRRFLRAILRRSDAQPDAGQSEIIRTVTIRDAIMWLKESVKEVTPGKFLTSSKIHVPIYL